MSWGVTIMKWQGGVELFPSSICQSVVQENFRIWMQVMSQPKKEGKSQVKGILKQVFI